MKHIVIVGGSFAGVSTAHRFLKNANKSMTTPYKVTLVSRDSHFFWNIAASRALIPGQIPDEKLFQPITGGFAQYGNKFEFILGTATGVDVDGKRLVVIDAEGNETRIGYDYLVLGAGSQTKVDGPFKSSGSTEALRERLHDFQKWVKDATSVVIVGAGPTGIETAGELAFEYGKSKEITLISSGPTVLENRPASVSKTALGQLETLGVQVKFNTKVKEPVQLPNGKQELILSGGERLLADLYIPTFGVLPNSSFVPSQFLDSSGFIKVDEYLSVEGAEGVFAIGDVSNVEAPQFWFVEKQSTHMAKNLVLAVSGKPPVPYKASTTGLMGIHIGKKSGTGHFGNVKVPSFLVSMIRKTLFIENLSRTVDGSML
ncbi:FAD/NAD(P)-binding domain-containing protein [Lentithecium fluviatile CBS 122367]|uniref:FAD/NAD(P)-binding domain-containing protein n=1 Tax=Lentithecium fluviatile CBS 122367 TaxID=1168545 RepID=A0A6G1JP11_9PLEO|nr:FAD/NAD(P)-binding domain-containing protein [Lentithecium fluviatile CBS 122367]